MSYCALDKPNDRYFRQRPIQRQQERWKINVKFSIDFWSLILGATGFTSEECKSWLKLLTGKFREISAVFEQISVQSGLWSGFSFNDFSWNKPWILRKYGWYYFQENFFANMKFNWKLNSDYFNGTLYTISKKRLFTSLLQKFIRNVSILNKFGIIFVLLF